jgi:ribonuclease P protein component
MDYSYPKAAKLKSKKIIELLFTEGKSVGKYPLRLVYIQKDFDDDVPLKMGVSVSKKYFKNAVDRNYFKRVLRECYRLNQHLLIDSLDQKYCFMFFYQTKDRLEYAEIHQKTILLFEKFVNSLKENETKNEN